MKGKSNSSKLIRFLRYLPLICLYLTTLPCNYSGQRINLRSNNSFPYSSKDESKLLENVDKAKEVIEDNSDVPVSENLVLATMLSVSTTTILLYLILSYLNSVSTVKHCLMLYLYQDLVRTFLMQCWLWAVTVIICFTNGNGIRVDEITAKIVSHCFYILNLHLLLTMNVMGFLKLYMAKEMVLDPSLPWGYDDLTIVKGLRLVGFLFANLFLATMYATGAHYKIYYNLIGDNRSLVVLPIGTSIGSGFIVFLLTICTISNIGAKLYQPKHVDSITMGVPEKMNYLTKMFIFIGVFIMMFGTFMNLVTGRNIWIFHFSLGVILGIMTPVGIILRTTQLKTYIQKNFIKSKSNITIIFRQKYVQVSSLNIFNRSSQIHPIV